MEEEIKRLKGIIEKKDKQIHDYKKIIEKKDLELNEVNFVTKLQSEFIGELQTVLKSNNIHMTYEDNNIEGYSPLSGKNHNEHEHDIPITGDFTDNE